jgi:hypothetical protein
MNSALHHVMDSLQAGEELIAAGVDELFRRWQASTHAVGRLCAGPERWQAALREMQVTVSLAEILRARTIP